MKNFINNGIFITVLSILLVSCQYKEYVANDVGKSLDSYQRNSATTVSNIDVNAEENYENTINVFKTSFKGGTTSRIHNITLAAQKLNGTVVKPNETFSYNNTIGPTSKNQGFMLGKRFIKGKEHKGYGGGVCQVSSTLYNAVLGAGLEVVERWPHSKAVTYVEKDKDAATSYGGIDFKFKNTFEYPIVINASVDSENVYVRISKVTGKVSDTTVQI